MMNSHKRKKGVNAPLIGLVLFIALIIWLVSHQ